MSWLDAISPQIRLHWSGTWERGFLEASRVIYDHELVIFLQGECELSLAGKTHRMAPGSFAIIPPGLLHATRAGDMRVRRHCFHFNWVFQTDDPERPLFTHPPAPPETSKYLRAPAFVPKKVFLGKVPEMKILEKKLRRFTDDWRGNRVVARGIFLEILLFLLAPLEKKTASLTGRQDELVYQVKTILDRLEKAGEEESVRKILTSLEYSYEHLARLFKKQTGLSPLRYLQHRKIDEARTLLGEPGAEVAQVAYRLGFNDPGYFGRLFRKNTGLSPSAFSGKKLS